MDVGVARVLGTVWQDVFDNDTLEELVSVRAIFEVKCDIIRVLLTISRHCDDDGAWHLHWSGLHDNVGIGDRLQIVDHLTELYLLVAHVWMIQALSGDVDGVGFIHRSIGWLDLPDVGIIVVEERGVGVGEGFTVG